MGGRHTPSRNRGRLRLLDTIQYRFVYEGGIKGEWYPVVLDAVHAPNVTRRVSRLEYRDEADLERVRPAESRPAYQ